ncbi:MAG: thioredoxin [Gammaproteobacteria bacterium]|nr:thioredoxin [Gammaproteobacteria bacterium]
MATIDLTKDNFEQAIQDNKIILLDFWATWCGPCKQFGPVFEAASDEHPDVVFAKVNTEEEQELAAQFQIRSIPTLMAIKEQVIVFSQPGALPASALSEIISKIKELDMDEVRKDIEKQQASS